MSAPAGAGRATRVPARADPPLRARSPVGVPPRLFPETSKRPRPTSGQASWDAAAIPTLTAKWALPTPACPSPVNAPHGLLVVAASMMPKAARVRVVTPPAGTALAPAFGSTSRRRPYRARFDSQKCNLISDECQYNSDGIFWAMLHLTDPAAIDRYSAPEHSHGTAQIRCSALSAMPKAVRIRTRTSQRILIWRPLPWVIWRSS